MIQINYSNLPGCTALVNQRCHNQMLDVSSVQKDVANLSTMCAV